MVCGCRSAEGVCWHISTDLDIDFGSVILLEPSKCLGKGLQN